ncbi:uncharacterized protein M421DRAFT_418356 [Didymella exigua CBS 183.55]|uniref:Uncharacterized protein n=1 Tax=Didymella exigua CBS 183.55 TaxID=1150837 RepID=A0A6A5RTU6_9PLEO|nr:uncharacterized protein M421DRAFT_418356 [Didymella exigua CBS 183.55]KAF1930883.1 hypothetical protein M421DRAFT_418356 [Didymella exigua CBS 183.55]
MQAQLRITIHQSPVTDAIVEIEMKKEEEDMFEVVHDAKGSGNQQDLASMRNKVLDRLAEILVTVKTNRAGQSRTLSFLEPKHVSATSMIIGDPSTAVGIFCSRDREIDQRGHGCPFSSILSPIQTGQQYSLVLLSRMDELWVCSMQILS